MILAVAPEPDNPRPRLHSVPEEIRKSPELTWQQNLYLRVWPTQVTGSRELGIALALGNKEAHSIATKLEALGLVKITEFEGEWLGWEWQDPPLTYRLNGHSPPPVLMHQNPPPVLMHQNRPQPSVSSLLPTTASRAVGSRETHPEDVGGNGASAFRITEDRFAHRGSLGRGSLLLAWEAEDRDTLGQRVKVADLVAWTGAHRNDVGRWLRRMEEHGAASHHPNRSWTITIGPSQTNAMSDDVVRAITEATTWEEKDALLPLLDRPIDQERIQRARILRYHQERKGLWEWEPSYKPPPYEIRPGSPFRRYKIEAEPEPARPLTMADFMPHKDAP